jgi:hypothetical protein
LVSPYDAAKRFEKTFLWLSSVPCMSSRRRAARSPIDCLVESDDKAWFPHSRLLDDVAVDDMNLMRNDLKERCGLRDDAFGMILQRFDVIHGQYVDIEESDLAPQKKRKRASGEEAQNMARRIKVKLVHLPGPRRKIDDTTKSKDSRGSARPAFENLGRSGTAYMPLSHSQQSLVASVEPTDSLSLPRVQISASSTFDAPIKWHIRPQKASDHGTTLVWTTLDLEQVGNMDVSQGVVYVRMILSMYWHDERIASHHTVGEPVNENLWRPSPQVKQAVMLQFKSRVLETTAQRGGGGFDGKKGDLYTLVEYGGNISNSMDLQDFPFDFNSIQITFLANSCSSGASGNVSYKTDYRLLFSPHAAFDLGRKGGHSKEGLVRVANSFEVPGFVFTKLNVKYINQKKAQDQVLIDVFVVRDAQPIYKMMVPLVMIFFLNAGTFRLGIMETNDRMTYSVTLFLASFTLISETDFTGGDQSCTSVDHLINFVNATLFITAAWSMIAHVLLQDNESDKKTDVSSASFAQSCSSRLVDWQLWTGEFSAWDAECFDSTLEFVFYVSFVAYCLILFLPRFLKKRAFVEEACRGNKPVLVADAETGTEFVNIENGKAYLSISECEERVVQISNDPLVDLPRWLAKKREAEIDGAREIGE